MIEFQKIWIEQCKAALQIQKDFGNEKALGYLIGEKLFNFIHVADNDPKWAEELPKFIDEIKIIFQPHEIRQYLDNVQRIGAFGHICTDEEHVVMEKTDPNATAPVYGAEAVLIMDKIKKLLIT